MRFLILLALLVPAPPGFAQPQPIDPASNASAGPWLDCIRAVGRAHRARRASVEEFIEALDSQCREQAEMVRTGLPNVYRLSREEARGTYAYCLRPNTDDSPRCRSLR